MKTIHCAAITLVLLSTAALVSAAPVAMAGPGPAATYAEVTAMADKMWTRMDANHDGRIDAADRDARMLEHFVKADTNHDGMVSKDEFLAQVHARAAQWHAHHPDDADGPPPPGHDGLDHDGPDQDGADHGPMHPGMGRHPGGMIGMAVIHPAMRAARHDDAITRPAFDAAIKARFAALDTDHNGTLTRDELRAAMRDAWGHAGHGPHHGSHDGAHHGEGMPPPPPADAM
ncbi:calcium-binding protein [Novosphingobium sp.]|uniref:EF-hand domain-containing protein n=1 Tax=Novosphingobium sp. TaxID=1874826 RepID=UPI00333FB00E